MAASEHLLGRPTAPASLGMVMASTGVAVMGSFAFGVAVSLSPSYLSLFPPFFLGTRVVTICACV
jgi:hypothetical protein